MVPIALADLSWFTESGSATGPGASDLLVRFGVALMLGMLVAAAYRHTHTGNPYQRSFLATLVGTAVVTTMIMGVVQTSVALSLGMFGAVSVIRFRSAIQDSRDLTFPYLPRKSRS